MNTDWSKPTKYIVGVSLALMGVLILYLSRPVIPLLIISALIHGGIPMTFRVLIQ